jgi:putative MATE family efflux protein
LSVAAPAVAIRTRALLDGPIVPTLLRLAAPNVVGMVLQAAISVLDAYFVSSLGADAIAGVSLAFPLIMLMQTMSSGGMGGGVSSAVARALGAGRRDDANALAVHALVIALVMGAVFSAGVLLGGPALYRAMGGTGGALDAALTYSNIVFAGALAPWLFNTLVSVVRGTGNMTMPALLVLGGSAVHLILCPALVFGWGPLPRLGVAGAGVAVVVNFSLTSAVVITYLASGRALVTLGLRGVRLRGVLFWEILRVGLPGALNTVFTNLTVVIVTAHVGRFGTAALAGFGIGTRLEYLQIPLVFGMGAALVAMVGTNIGAGQRARARRVAFTGAGIAAGVSGTIGLGAALFPLAWLGWFSSDPDVLEAGTRYLRIVGPTYGFFGLGLALYFASQGAGRLMWPLLAGAGRLVIAGVGGWLVVGWLGGGLGALYAVIALAFVVFGTSVALAVKGGAWR